MAFDDTNTTRWQARKGHSGIYYEKQQSLVLSAQQRFHRRPYLHSRKHKQKIMLGQNMREE
jgi:hypothetical protein